MAFEFSSPTESDDGGGIFDFDDLLAPVRGVEGAVHDVANLFGAGLTDEDRFAGTSDTFVGGAIEGISNFLVGFVPGVGVLSKVGKIGKAGKLLNLTKKAERAAKIAGKSGAATRIRLTRDFAAGAAADFAVFGGHEERLSDLIESSPALANPISEYLSSDEEDSELEGRLKNALEGAGLGGALDGLLAGFRKMRGPRPTKATVSDELEFGDPRREGLIGKDDIDPEAQAARNNPAAVPADIETELADSFQGAIGPDLSGEKALQGELRKLAPKSDRAIYDAAATRSFDSVGQHMRRQGGKSAQVGYAMDLATHTEKAVKSGNMEADHIASVYRSMGERLPHDFGDDVVKDYRAATRDNPNAPELEDWLADLTRKPTGALSKYSTATRQTVSHGRAVMADTATAMRVKHGPEKAQAIITDNFKGIEARAEYYDVDGRALPTAPKTFILARLGMTEQSAKRIEEAMAARTAEGVPDGVNPRDLSHAELLKYNIQSTGMNTDIYMTPNGLGHFAQVMEDMTSAFDEAAPRGEAANAAAVDYDDKVWKRTRDALLDPTEKNHMDAMVAITGSVEEMVNTVKSIQPKVHAYDMMNAMVWDHVQTLSKKLEAAGGGDDLLRLQHRQAMEMAAVVSGGQRAIKGETARSLRLYQMDVETMSPKEWASASPSKKQALRQARRMEEIYAKNGGVDGGAAAVAKALRPTIRQRALSLTQEYFINSILSGPKTMLVNGLGGVMMSGWGAAEKAMGGITGYAIEAATRGGQQSQFARQTREAFREMQHLAAGYTDLFLDGFRLMNPKNSNYSEAGKFAGQATVTGKNLADGTNSVRDVATLESFLKDFNQTPETKGAVMGMWARKAMTIPSHILAGTDEAVKQVTARARLKSVLTEEAIGTGLKGADVADFVEGQMGKVFLDGQLYSHNALYNQGLEMARARGETSPDAAKRFADSYAFQQIESTDGQVLQELAEKGREGAQKATFTTPLKDGTISANIQDFVNATPWARLVLPFVRTPANILAWASSRLATPITAVDHVIGKISPELATNLRRQGETLAKSMSDPDPSVRGEAYGRFIAGTGATLAFTQLVFTGRVTGGGPKDPDQRRALEATGWLPYSMKVGDSYVSYDRIDPFRTMLGTLADLGEVMQWSGEENQEDAQTAVISAVAAMTNNFTNKSYLTGVKAFTDLIFSPIQETEGFFERYAETVVPNFISQGITQPFEDDLVHTRSLVDSIRKRLPGYGDSLEPVRDVFGKPVKRIKSIGADSKIGGFSWTDAFVPLAAQSVKDNEIASELIKLPKAFSAPRSTKQGVDLLAFSKGGQTAYDRYQELVGTTAIGGSTLQTRVRALIRNKSYQALEASPADSPTSPRVVLIERLIERYKSAAWAKLLKEYPEVNDERIRLRQAKRLARTGF